MAPSKGASLDPSTHQGGGQVPNGTYDIVKSRAALFTYPGKDATVPAQMVTFKDAGVEYEQMYKAGDTEHLVPSDDGKRFVHPHGEAAAIYKGGACSMFLGSLAKQGFTFTGDDLSQIEGIRVQLESFAAPKGKSSENAEKQIPLVTKILTAAKQTRPTQQAGRAPAASTSTTAATSTASNAGANGSLDQIAIRAVLTTLAAAPDATLKVKGLAVRCLKAAPGTPLNTLTKLITDQWLKDQAAKVGWETDGDTVSYAGLDNDSLNAIMEAIQ